MCWARYSLVRFGALSHPYPIHLWVRRPRVRRSARQDLYPNRSEPLRVRLPEQSSQRKQQSVGPCRSRHPFGSRRRPSLIAKVNLGFLPEKQLKKVLTVGEEI